MRCARRASTRARPRCSARSSPASSSRRDGVTEQLQVADLHLLPRARRDPRGAAAALRRARRDALHRRPPGLRALVQGAAPRARTSSGCSRRATAPRRSAPQAHPHDPEARRRAARRDRDAPAHAVPELPRPARVGERLPVGAVPSSRRCSAAATAPCSALTRREARLPPHRRRAQAALYDSFLAYLARAATTSPPTGSSAT